jgi:hypothetical protein
MTTTPARPHDSTSGTHSPASSRTPRRGRARTVGRWLMSFLGFPIGGYVAFLTLGPLESTPTAVAGGALAGVVLGLAQGWAFGPTRPHVVAWVLTTAAGLAVGTALGAAATDYATDVTSLVLLGAVTGMSVGIAQAVVLHRRLGAPALLWPLILTGAWALGWRVSQAVIGSSVDQQFYIFGASGALVVAILTSPLAVMLERRVPVDTRSPAARPAGMSS